MFQNWNVLSVISPKVMLYCSIILTQNYLFLFFLYFKYKIINSNIYIYIVCTSLQLYRQHDRRCASCILSPRKSATEFLRTMQTFCALQTRSHKKSVVCTVPLSQILHFFFKHKQIPYCNLKFYFAYLF